jgi:hypothetical protein
VHCPNYHTEREKLKELNTDFLVVPRRRETYLRTNNYAKFSQSETNEIYQPRLPHSKINKKDLAIS